MYICRWYCNPKWPCSSHLLKCEIWQYLGITLHKRLTKGSHQKPKDKELNSRLHVLRPILESKMSIQTKNTVHKLPIRYMWAYDLWNAGLAGLELCQILANSFHKNVPILINSFLSCYFSSSVPMVYPKTHYVPQNWNRR